MQLILLFISKYIFGYLLQGFIFILGIYTFSKEKIDRRAFLLMLSVLIPTNIVVRILPISYGIHILVNVAIILYVTYQFSTFELYVIIRSTLLITLLVLFTEMLCFASLILFFGQETSDAILQDSLNKALIYVPFNLLLGAFIYILYKKMLKKNYRR